MMSEGVEQSTNGDLSISEVDELSSGSVVLRSTKSLRLPLNLQGKDAATLQRKVYDTMWLQEMSPSAEI